MSTLTSSASGARTAADNTAALWRLLRRVSPLEASDRGLPASGPKGTRPRARGLSSSGTATCPAGRAMERHGLSDGLRSDDPCGTIGGLLGPFNLRSPCALMPADGPAGTAPPPRARVAAVAAPTWPCLLCSGAPEGRAGTVELARHRAAGNRSLWSSPGPRLLRRRVTTAAPLGRRARQLGSLDPRENRSGAPKNVAASRDSLASIRTRRCACRAACGCNEDS